MTTLTAIEETAAADPVRLAPRPRKLRKDRLTPGRMVVHLACLVGGSLFAAPFLWMLLTSVKPLKQILQAPLSILPWEWTWSNYADAWNALPFGSAYWNSFYICVVVIVGTLLTGAMAAYGFARIDFPGAKALFLLFLAMQMVPKQVTIVPFYLLMSKIGWVDSHLALIVPAMLCNPFAVFLLRQFVRSLPLELEEAALLDGAGRLRSFWHIVLPNIRPGLGAIGVVVALDTWNNFFYPLVLLNTDTKFTLPLLLSAFQGSIGGVNYALIMAASAITVVPMLIAFLLGQRWILNSMAMSGMGGR